MVFFLAPLIVGLTALSAGSVGATAIAKSVIEKKPIGQALGETVKDPLNFLPVGPTKAILGVGISKGIESLATRGKR